MTNNEEIRFPTFMATVNIALDQLAGVSDLDIPDYDYASDFEAGRGALATAKAALHEAGGF